MSEFFSNLGPFLESLFIAIAFLVMIFSLIGLVIPIFPGNVIMWLVALIYGLIAGFGTTGWILTVLMIAAVLVDNVLMGTKARQEGAAWGSIAAGLLAGIVGTLVFPPVGGLIAAPLVLYLLERRRIGEHEKALSTVKALLIGWGWAFAARFGIGLVMILLWGIWVFQNS